MLGQVDVALRRDRTTVEYHRTVVSVQEQATRLRQIIETLLFLSREDAESSPPESERIELNGWLCEHLTTWKLHPRHDDLRLEADASQPLWVSVHAGLLGQAVDNLLDNACKYSKPGSTIRARTAHTESTALLAVEDCGYGIPEEDVAYVLEPFFRSTDARRRGVDGAGLGLSLVNRIASTLGGQVVVQSIIGRGSVFTLSFPSAAELQRSSTKAAETSLREIETQSCETVHP
jgi:signal transduction histidine kinase